MVGFGGVRACRGVHVWSGAACKQGASLCTHGLRRAGGSLRSARAPPRWTNASPKPVPVSVAPRAADSAACAPLPQFSGLHKEQTPDPCAVAGIFGCNAGAMTHAARGGAGYVNINGYKVGAGARCAACCRFPCLVGLAFRREGGGDVHACWDTAARETTADAATRSPAPYHCASRPRAPCTHPRAAGRPWSTGHASNRMLPDLPRTPAPTLHCVHRIALVGHASYPDRIPPIPIPAWRRNLTVAGAHTGDAGRLRGGPRHQARVRVNYFWSKCQAQI